MNVRRVLKVSVAAVVALLGVLLVASVLFGPVGVSEPYPIEVTYSRALELVQSGKVASLVGTPTETSALASVVLSRKDGSPDVVVLMPPVRYEPFLAAADKAGVAQEFEKAPVSGSESWVAQLFSPFMLMMVMLMGLLVWSVLYTSGRIGRAKAPDQVAVPETRLDSLAGVSQIRAELEDTIDLLRNREAYQARGVSTPSGILMEGPPGTGKTQLAKAVAGELGAPFLAASGPDFKDKFVGGGAGRIHELFRTARKLAQRAGMCVVFIDEVDAIGARRGGGDDGGAREHNATLNKFLAEMDGIGDNAGIIFLAATNHQGLLDPALVRSGRFSKTITVPLPNREDRAEILALYIDKQNGSELGLDPAVNIPRVAARLSGPRGGFSGADIEEFVAEAVRIASRRGSGMVQLVDMEEALSKMNLGLANTSLRFSEGELRLTAWHEAGHALCAFLQPAGPDPVQVTCVPRGPAGGVTWLEEVDDLYMTRRQVFAHLVVSMGGRAAEEMLLDGDFSTGPGSDCVNASSVARKMVVELGFSSMGPQNRSQVQTIPGIADRIDAEIDRLLDEALMEARALLIAHSRLLAEVAGMLVERDTIHLEDLHDLHNTFGADPVAVERMPT